MLTPFCLCYTLRMQRTRGGFTIIEVLVVLAISMVLFFAAIRLFAGRQGTTQFAQAMRDVASQIQSIVNDVGVSTFPDLAGMDCELNAGRPALVSGSNDPGTSQECIFLGKAVLIDSDNNPNTPDELDIFTILGRRAIGGSTIVTNFDDANPEPIDELDESYIIPFMATVLSATQDVSPAGRPAYMMGFYNSLQPTGAGIAQGSQSIKTIGYAGIGANAPNGLVKNAIRQLPDPSPYSIEDSKVWTICFQSGTSDETAQLIVSSTSAGVTTEVKYTSCS